MPSTPPRRLLLVEDSPINRTVAAAFLTKAGYCVDVAANGLEAVAAVRAAAYDLVLMDVAMPEMDGLEATRAIRALPGPAGRVPILAMTADTEEEDRARCLATGMDDHVPKPVDRARLLEAVARWLDAAPPEPGVLDGAVLEQLSRDIGPDLAADIVREFLDETAARVERIAVEPDVAVLLREAHTLKSTSATFGAARLSAVALELEMACHAGEEARINALRTRVAGLAGEALEAYRVRGVAG